jgi:hypothetical protein
LPDVRAVIALSCLVALTLPRRGYADEACPPEEADATRLARCVDDSTSSIPEFEKLRPSDSPAFSMLGVAPTEVQKPSSLREVAVSLSKFVDASGDLLVPDNLAVEIAPYQLVADRPVADGKESGVRGASLYRNLGISIGARSVPALVDAGAEDEVTDKELAVGVRTLLEGEALDPTCLELGERLQMAAQLSALHPTPEELALPREQALARLRERKAASAATIAPLLEGCEKAQGARTWSVEAAVAMRWFFPEGVSDEGRIRGAAGWVTGAYSWKGVDAVGFLRYGGDKPASDWTHNVDLGLQVVIARDRYAASLEGIARKAWRPAGDDGDEGQYRVAIAADYKIGEGKWLTFSFGKDFAEDDAGSLFSLANLTYAFGEPRVVKAKEPVLPEPPPTPAAPAQPPVPAPAAPPPTGGPGT